MTTPFENEDFDFLREIFASHYSYMERKSLGKAERRRATELFVRLHTIMTEVTTLAIAHQQLKEK